VGCSADTVIRSMTNGTAIVSEIRARYVRDRRIPHPDAIALSEHDGTVTLRGTVGSLYERRTAASIARSTRGVRTVENQLKLDPRDGWQDGEIQGAALQALMSNDEIPADRIDVRVSNGWLTLTGEVKLQAESNAAFEAVSGLPGVGGITNKIAVITAGIH
jgi:osmotically-inducible protein OsmY